MELKDLKLLFDAGSLKKAIITHEPMLTGYLLMIDHHVLDTKRGRVRIFKTIDAACKAAKDIGFNRIEVRI